MYVKITARNHVTQIFYITLYLHRTEKYGYWKRSGKMSFICFTKETSPMENHN